MRLNATKSIVSEKEFASAFLNGTPRMRLGTDIYNFIDEVETLAGVPDAVAIKNIQVDQLNAFKKIYKRINFTNGNAKIISRLNRVRWIDESKALQMTGMNPNYFHKHLLLLERAGVVERDKKNIKLTKRFIIPEIEIISIEFKLTAWKPALRQAMRYKTFSSRVCVLMPANKELVLRRNEAVFRKMKVGAAVFDNQKNVVRYIVKPQKNSATARHFYIDTLGRLLSKR